MKKIVHAKKLAVLAVVGVLGVGGVLGGASAFFTDRASTVGKTNAGTFDMTLTNYSDLDGNYRTWATDGTSTSKLTVNGQRTAKFTEKAADDSAKSVGIINPGDTGILQFSVKNAKEKSMDVMAQVVVTSTVPFTSATAAEYSIDGLGTPTLSADKLTLTYPTEKLGIINGTVETETDGAASNTEIYYAYNVDFARDAKNAFQDANFTVTVNAYAKQHRNTFDSDWDNIGSFEVTT